MGFVLQSLHYEVCIMECRVMQSYGRLFESFYGGLTCTDASCTRFMWVSLCEFAASPSVTEVYP